MGVEVDPQIQEKGVEEEVHLYREVEEAVEDHFWYLEVVEEEVDHQHSCQGVVVEEEEADHHHSCQGVVEEEAEQPRSCQGVEVVADHPHSCRGVVVHLMQMEPVEEGVVVVGLVHSFLKWGKVVA